MRGSRRAPRPLAPALAELRSSLMPPTTLAEIQQAWGAAVGEAIAAEAQPVAERAGVLTVSCAAAVWAQELDLMADAIITRLNGALGRRAVTRLRCVAAPATGGR